MTNRAACLKTSPAELFRLCAEGFYPLVNAMQHGLRLGVVLLDVLFGRLGDFLELDRGRADGFG